MAKPNSLNSLGEARTWLRDHLEEGERCPCCERTAKVYKRTIHTTMARNLIRAYRAHYQAPFRPIDLLGATSPDFVKLRYWDLLVEVDPETVRDDGSPRTGRWSITNSGIAFIRDAVKVPKYAHIYDGRRLKHSGDPVGIRDCLGQKFSYAALMNA